MNILGYGRVSSVGQEEGDGYARQEVAIKEFCKRHNLKILFLVEEAISGTIDGLDRPKLAEFLGLNAARNSADPAHFDAIVVERMDRLARDLMVQELLIREFQKRGIKLFSADQGELIDMADACPDPTRKLIRQVLGAVAEFEKSNLVRKLHSARVRMGRMGGNVAYGSRPGEAQTVVLIEDLRAGGASWREIADRLNEESLVQRNRKPWTHGAVQSMMNSRKEVTMR